MARLLQGAMLDLSRREQGSTSLPELGSIRTGARLYCDQNKINVRREQGSTFSQGEAPWDQEQGSTVRTNEIYYNRKPSGSKILPECPRATLNGFRSQA